MAVSTVFPPACYKIGGALAEQGEDSLADGLIPAKIGISSMKSAT